MFFIIVFLFSCGNTNKEKSNIAKIYQQDGLINHIRKISDHIKDTNEIVGHWFIPHSAKVNIRFFNNGRFEFNDYNLRLDKYELLIGIYKLVDSTVILIYDDRPRQYFKFYKEDDTYYIKKKGYYFVKGDSF